MYCDLDNFNLKDELNYIIDNAKHCELIDYDLLENIFIKDFDNNIITDFIFDLNVNSKKILAKFKILEYILNKRNIYYDKYQSIIKYLIEKKYYKKLYNLFKNNKEIIIKLHTAKLLKTLNYYYNNDKFKKYYNKIIHKNNEKKLIPDSFNIF